MTSRAALEIAEKLDAWIARDARDAAEMLRTQHAKIVNLTDQLSPKAPGLTERELYLMGCALLAGEDYSDLDEWLREPVEDGGVDRETYLAKAATAKDEKNTEAEQ